MKSIGAAEFKKQCLRILDEVHATGEPVTVTKRGKPVAVVNPKGVAKTGEALTPLFGILKNDKYSFPDPFAPTEDLWDKAFDRKWDRLL